MAHDTKLDTGALCVSCDNEIRAEVTIEPPPGVTISDGPDSWRDRRPRVVSISCSNKDCALLYIHPPGKLNWRADTEKRLLGNWTNSRGMSIKDSDG